MFPISGMLEKANRMKLVVILMKALDIMWNEERYGISASKVLYWNVDRLVFLVY